MIEMSLILNGGIFVGLCVLAWYFYSKKHHLPKLHHEDSDLHQYIVKSKPRFTSPYKPPFWLRNKHLQTIISSLMPKPKTDFKREHIDMEDGAVLAVDWVTNNEADLTETSSVLIILPGLTAGREDMATICNEAARRGYRAVVFNKRGHGNTVLTTPKLLGFGDTSDLRFFIMKVHREYPDAKIVSVGFSAGSGLLASYSGEYGEDSLLTCGVAVSPGYDSRDMFGRTLTGVYEYFLLSNLKKVLMKHAKTLASVVDVGAAYRTSTFREFDEHVYCRIYGYKDAHEYWTRHNPMRNFENISAPIMSINSEDDPVCLKENIPIDLFAGRPDCMLVLTQEGGHCGFLEGWKLQPWADLLALDYTDAVLEFTSLTNSDD